MTITIPFNRPYASGKEFEYIKQACFSGHISGDGEFTKKCHEWLRSHTGCANPFLTHSGTAALEMAALIADIRPGDEVIMPSYTFVSTANAFVLRGAIPVFVDIREDTLNIDETLLEAAITTKTRAIVPVHYAGVACEMDSILAIAKKYNLLVIEDAAQGICSSYKGKMLGSIGNIGALSFHETKNLISGEGGAILVSDSTLLDRVDIVWQKGTNRKKFNQGLVDKYTWIDIGSSFLPSDIIAAFLLAQFEASEPITATHKSIWEKYHAAFAVDEAQGLCIRPHIPSHCAHNAHFYHIVVAGNKRARMLAKLREKGIGAVFHYVPLHSAPAGIKYGRVSGSMLNTDRLSAGVVRLPMWVELSSEQQGFVIEAVKAELRAN